MGRKLWLLVVALACFQLATADEGMWPLGDLNKNKAAKRAMKELGMKMPVRKIYDPKRPSLSDAVVSFGGFCSGVVVSEEGLVLTNHHCGFGSIQEHSTVEHDYLTDGFSAGAREEELPCPGLFVRFLIRTEDVTERVLSAARGTKTEAERQIVIDSVANAVADEVSAADSTLFGVVDAYYAGNEFRLSVYRDFNDVRLVFAPPSSVGKFGGETDNWTWPRHTGDFSVFRIYSDKDNAPADYSPDNVPYRPRYVAPVSIDGYREGSFCMTLGYPGVTERYLSSYGIEEMMNGANQAMIDVRGVKQAIWKREMDSRPDIRIKYASKYDKSSNYWKNSLGVNRAIRRLKVLERKRAAESALRQWIYSRPDERERLLHLFSSLELGYGQRRQANRAMAYFAEAFLNGPELVQLAINVLNFDFGAGKELVESRADDLREQYANLDFGIDKEVFAAMLKAYRSKVDEAYLPDTYRQIDTLYGGDERAYVEGLYAASKLTSAEGLERFLARDTAFHVMSDPAVALGLDLIVKYYEMSQSVAGVSERIARDERLFNAAMRRMNADRGFYPDANSTMRLSFGTVRGYTPFDGADYDYRTTVKGIIEKARKHTGEADFTVQPGLLSLLASGDFGRYANDEGGMNVCFISDNDITGGNSGSAMFNAKGELLGLAFDGNWEAMSGDVMYEPALQRCVGVDIRYVLFIIEKYGKASDLIREMNVL